MPIGVPRVRRSEPKKKFERKKNQKGEKGFLKKVINFDKSEVDEKEVDEKEVDEAGYEGEVNEEEVYEAGYEGEVDEEEVDEAGSVDVDKVDEIRCCYHEAGSGKEEEEDEFYPVDRFRVDPYKKPRIKINPLPRLTHQQAEKEQKLREAGWIDLYEQLYREGYIFLFRKLTKRVTNNIISIMIFLNMQDPTNEQFLFINSRGGKILRGIAVYETIGGIQADVNTIGLGVAASMGAFILSGGTPTKRLAFPHVRVMIHEPKYVVPKNSTPVDVSMDRKELKTLYSYLVENFSRVSGRSREMVIDDLKREKYMSATEARDYGIVDSVVATAKQGLV